MKTNELLEKKIENIIKAIRKDLINKLAQAEKEQQVSYIF